MSTRKSIVDANAAIQAELDSANGKRRLRTVSYAEATQAIRAALRDGYGYVNGGPGANKYGHPAYQTIVTAIAAEQSVRVEVFGAQASKGHGTGLPWPRAATAEEIDRVIKAILWTPARKGEIRLSRRTAKAIVAAQDHAERIPA